MFLVAPSAFVCRIFAVGMHACDPIKSGSMGEVADKNTFAYRFRTVQRSLIVTWMLPVKSYMPRHAADLAFTAAIPCVAKKQ